LRSRARFETKAQARAAVAAWIEDYNHVRRHSAPGMRSPVAWEQAAREQEGQPCPPGRRARRRRLRRPSVRDALRARGRGRAAPRVRGGDRGQARNLPLPGARHAVRHWQQEQPSGERKPC
jgi:hypothetical protein